MSLSSKHFQKCTVCLSDCHEILLKIDTTLENLFIYKEEINWLKLTKQNSKDWNNHTIVKSA